MTHPISCPFVAQLPEHDEATRNHTVKENNLSLSQQLSLNHSSSASSETQSIPSSTPGLGFRLASMGLGNAVTTDPSSYMKWPGVKQVHGDKCVLKCLHESDFLQAHYTVIICVLNWTHRLYLQNSWVHLVINYKKKSFNLNLINQKNLYREIFLLAFLYSPFASY